MISDVSPLSKCKSNHSIFKSSWVKKLNIFLSKFCCVLSEELALTMTKPREYN
jgi:hypothetical protein